MIAQHQSRTNRKRRLCAIAMLMIPAALFFCSLNAPVSAAQNGIESIYDFVPDTSSLSNLPSTDGLPSTGATFYIQGKIYPLHTVNQATCAFAVGSPRVVGSWRAWGEVADDGRVVIKMSVVLECCGATLEVQGTSGLLARTGNAAPAISGTFGEPFTGPTEVLSVVGGAGALRGFNGEAEIRPYCQSKSELTRPFRYDRPFCFLYIEAKRK